MATRVTTITLDDGGLAVSKTALSGDRADRMAEARWLAEARGSFVVRLLDVGGDPVTIQTEHGGQRTLRTAREDPPAMARLLVRLARGIADLHGRGFVHGKLTLDHVLVDGESTVRVCSPSGIATEPVDDLRAIGSMIDDLLARWDDEDTDVDARPEWERLATKLGQADEHVSAHRIARWLAPLAVERAVAPTDDERPRRLPGSATQAKFAGVALLASFVLLVTTARFVGPFAADEAHASTADAAFDSDPIEVGGAWYRFDRPDGIAVATPSACSVPLAAYLEPATDTVWLVDVDHRGGGDAVEAGSSLPARPGAIVPGATMIMFEIDDAGVCRLWASGAAGRSEVPTERS